MKRVKILLIEDDRLLRDLYAQALELGGYTVLVAGDAQSGLDQLDEYGAQLIILDLMLPAHGGIEVLHELQSQPDWQNIPVIVLSAVAKHRVPAGMGELGVVAYLDKSATDPAQLINSIKELL